MDRSIQIALLLALALAAVAYRAAFVAARRLAVESAPPLGGAGSGRR